MAPKGQKRVYGRFRGGEDEVRTDRSNLSYRIDLARARVRTREGRRKTPENRALWRNFGEVWRVSRAPLAWVGSPGGVCREPPLRGSEAPGACVASPPCVGRKPRACVASPSLRGSEAPSARVGCPEGVCREPPLQQRLSENCLGTGFPLLGEAEKSAIWPVGGLAAPR